MLYLPCGYDLKANAGVTAAFFCSVLSRKMYVPLAYHLFEKEKKKMRDGALE